MASDAAGALAGVPMHPQPVPALADAACRGACWRLHQRPCKAGAVLASVGFMDATSRGKPCCKNQSKDAT